MIVLVSGDRRDENECRATTREQGAEGDVRKPKEGRARTATEGGAEGGWREEGRTTEGGGARGGGWRRQEEGEDDGEVA